MAFAEMTLAADRPPALSSLSSAALFLDLDGTLAPIAARPQDVRPDPRRTALLERLKRALDGRLAVVSGRTLADIDRILEGRVQAAAAVHGLVHRDCEGLVRQATPHPRLPHAIEGLSMFAEQDVGLLVENKGVSATLHYRLAPAFAEAAAAIARRIAEDTGLFLQPGDMVMELRTPGPSKGDSVREFMRQPAFEGAQPVFVGDDLTDEHGFAAARDLGGFGVLVGAARPTAARYRIPDVEAVLDWLEAAP
jgi:trehalose 6-phosphate phosphatase